MIAYVIRYVNGDGEYSNRWFAGTRQFFSSLHRLEWENWSGARTATQRLRSTCINTNTNTPLSNAMSNYSSWMDIGICGLSPLSSRLIYKRVYIYIPRSFKLQICYWIAPMPPAHALIKQTVWYCVHTAHVGLIIENRKPTHITLHR